MGKRTGAAGLGSASPGSDGSDGVGPSESEDSLFVAPVLDCGDTLRVVWVLRGKLGDWIVESLNSTRAIQCVKNIPVGGRSKNMEDAGSSTLLISVKLRSEDECVQTHPKLLQLILLAFKTKYYNIWGNLAE